MSKESGDDVDPDYATNNIALKRAEKLKEGIFIQPIAFFFILIHVFSENINDIEKLKEVLNQEFNKDLAERQNQLEQIEKQIHKTKKLLHLMRYVLISSYYNKKELEYNGNEEASNKKDPSYLFDQNRIHPALKKLLGTHKLFFPFNII